MIDKKHIAGMVKLSFWFLEFRKVIQVINSGAPKILLPITSVADMSLGPPELMDKFNLISYQSPEADAFRALGAK